MTATADGAIPSRTVVLLVDADPTDARFEAEALEARGYRVERAASCEEARELAGRVAPDLILIDPAEADASGLLACAELRRALDAPLVICSRTDDPRQRALGLKLGADDF